MRFFSKVFSRRRSAIDCVGEFKKPTVVDVHRDVVINKEVFKYLAWSMLFLMLGCMSFIWSLKDLVLSEALRMRESMPAFHWWQNPTALVLCRIYVFNITNYDAFLNGNDSKLNLQEVGPFVFREALKHTDIVRNDNDTLTYISHRELQYLPEMNHININDTINVPNIAYLGISAFIAHSPFLARLAFNVLARNLKAKPVISMSIGNYLFNNTDTLLSLASKFAPSIVPIHNMGIVSMIYKDFADQVTVHMGTEKPRKFFTMDQYHGKPRFDYWPNETCDAVSEATEGVLYHQNIQKDDKLHFFRKTICRVTPVVFQEEVQRLGVNGYKFVLPLDTFHRPKNGSYDCYTVPGRRIPPDGVSDISSCFYGFPLSVSFPHFLGAEPKLQGKLDGLTPDEDKHGSFVVVEPNSGIPLESNASLQGNLVLPDLFGFERADYFSHTYFPIFWLQLNQANLPDIIATTVYIAFTILPRLQTFMSALFMILACTFLIIGVFRFQTKSKKVVYSYIPQTT